MIIEMLKMQFVTWMVNVTMVELSHNSRGGGNHSGRDHGDSSSDLKYYECSEPGHSRDCLL